MWLAMSRVPTWLEDAMPAAQHQPAPLLCSRRLLQNSSRCGGKRTMRPPPVQPPGSRCPGHSWLFWPSPPSLSTQGDPTILLGPAPAHVKPSTAFVVFTLGFDHDLYDAQKFECNETHPRTEIRR